MLAIAAPPAAPPAARFVALPRIAARRARTDLGRDDRARADLGRDRRGIAALELALVLPLFVLLLAGTIDVGSALYVRLSVESAVSAAANYAIVNAASVNSTNGASLATSLAQVMSQNVGGAVTAGVVVVNGGPTVTITNGTTAPSGTASNADSCYCPTGSPGSWTWGAAVTCGNACPMGGIAGKFVTFTLSQNYTPIFSSYGFVQNGEIVAGAIAQTQ